MTTDMLPADGAPSDAPVDPPPPPRRNSWVAVLVTLTGGVLIIGLIAQAVVVGLNAGGGMHSASYTAAVDGVTHLDLDVEAGDLVVSFADVDEAQLDVESSGSRTGGDWRLEADGDRLVVREDDRWWDFWPDFGSSRTTATLVLPEALEGAVSADLQVSAGSMELAGDLTVVNIDVSAGSLTFNGASTSVGAEISAGDANVTTHDAEVIEVQVSAGRFTGTFTGAQPQSTFVDVSAGDANLNLPDGSYAESGEVSAGDRIIEVRTDPASPHSLEVHVSAGDARIGYSD